MKHLELLPRLGPAEDPAKGLHRRAAGQFYTHEIIGRHLARAVADAMPTEATASATWQVLDPFCGDGRLVRWLMEEVASRGLRPSWKVSLWDVDEDAVRAAQESVRSTATSLHVEAEIEGWAGDSFRRGAESDSGTAAIVITNPPWENLKSDHRELVDLSEEDGATYRQMVRTYSDQLRAWYPHSRPQGAFAGWATNLSRTGTELSVRLTAPGGVAGVVCPASLFADGSSGLLRRHLFDGGAVTDIAFFPAEARLFTQVDQPALAFAYRRARDTGTTLRLTRYDKGRTAADTGLVRADRATLEARDFVIPVAFGAVGFHLLDRLAAFPALRQLEESGEIWAGREVDETGRQAFVHEAPNEQPFLKGRHIGRYRFVESPTEFVRPGAVRIPRSTGFHRLVWRDVSRPNQKRRMIGTLVPPGFVCGNSLGVMHSLWDDKTMLATMAALLFSIPAEYQVRSLLATGHVSLGVVRKIRLPELVPALRETLLEEVTAAIRGDSSAELRIEAAVARAYGLSATDWSAMLQAFPKFDLAQREVLKELVHD